jgi:hypothetical protein
MLSSPVLRAALGGLLVCVSLQPTLGHADWPMLRHDGARSATGAGAARITTPAIAFRRYLGGSLGADQYIAHDVDGDSRPEVILVVGGALVAKTPRDVVVWETPALDITRIDGLVDLDGDAVPELVASARAGRLHVVDPRDGSVRFSLPSGVVGNVGAVRFAALDALPGLDLYVAEQACGATGALGDAARAYSFAGGLAAPTVLFDLERGRRDYVCGYNDAILDVDGDGALEVVAQGVRHFYVYSAVDGHLISESEDVGSIPYGQATVFLAQADDDIAPELVCATDNDYAAPTNSRRLFVLDWDATASRLVRRWESSVADQANDRHAWYPGGVGNVGGDPRVEVVSSFYTRATASWSTSVYDVRDGTVIASVAQGPFLGTVDLDGDGVEEILAGDASGGVAAYRLEGSSLTRVFLAPAISPVYVRDWSDTTAPAATRRRPLAIDLDGDGRRELIAIRSNADGSTSLLGLASSSDPPGEVARLDIEPGITLRAFQPFEGVTRPSLQPLVVRSDGYLWILDDDLEPTNADLGGEIPERGLRTGGYYSGELGIVPVPIAADLDADGADDIVVRDSRGVLLRLDARDATLIEPPSVVREHGGVWAIATELEGDARPELVIASGSDITALREDGGVIWSTVVGTAVAGIAGDLVPGDLSGDGTPDIVFQLVSGSTGNVLINALDGDSGARLWASDYETLVAGSGLGTSAVHDRDGDARLDVLATPRNLFAWLSAIDGREVATVDAGYPGVGVLHDVDRDGATEIVAAGAVYGMRGFELDLTAMPAPTEATLHTRVLGAIASCPAEARMVQGHHASARVTTWNAANGAVLRDVALLDGRVWDPPSSAPDRPGTIGNVTIAGDLTGDGAPTALIPSTDGWLYALEPCSGTLRWALDFRYPVGEAIVADPDGDGEIEIVVTVADGFLYGIDREVLPAPAWVYENDGRALATTADEDVDELITTARLWANWAPVAGATAYEYAVITPGGAFLTSPPFIGVGGATEIASADLPLRAGQRYLFAVRAIGAEGTSSEALSDGVVVLPDPCASCGEGRICREGSCVPDPCYAITCAPSAMCVEGTCVERGADGGVETGRDGGPRAATGSGCCSIAAGAGGRGPGAGAIGLAAVIAGVALRRRRRRVAR